MLEPLFNKIAGLKASNFIKKEAPTQVFSCEYCEIFRTAFFIAHLWGLLLSKGGTEKIFYNFQQNMC